MDVAEYWKNYLESRQCFRSAAVGIYFNMPKEEIGLVKSSGHHRNRRGQWLLLVVVRHCQENQSNHAHGPSDHQGPFGVFGTQREPTQGSHVNGSRDAMLASPFKSGHGPPPFKVGGSVLLLRLAVVLSCPRTLMTAG